MPAEIIVFPDTTQLFCNYLRDELVARGYPALHVATFIPRARPNRFVRVLRTGGTRRNVVIDESQLTFEVWDSTEPGAHDLAQLARGLIVATRGTVLAGVPIYRVDDVTGPGALPSGPVATQDPVSHQIKVSFSMLVAARGAVVA